MKGNEKVLIIGAGMMGREHARAYSEIEGVEVFGIVDRIKDKAKQFSAHFNCSCFYSSFHKEIFIKSLDAKMHVICEKPLTLDSFNPYKRELEYFIQGIRNDIADCGENDITYRDLRGEC